MCATTVKDHCHGKECMGTSIHATIPCYEQHKQFFCDDVKMCKCQLIRSLGEMCRELICLRATFFLTMFCMAIGLRELEMLALPKMANNCETCMQLVKTRMYCLVAKVECQSPVSTLISQITPAKRTFPI